MRFDWDKSKQRTNLRKHGVSFDEAVEAFFDDYGIVVGDPDHSADEDRFVLIGASHKLRLLVVCHCYREDDKVVRLISARKANKRETSVYNRGRRS